MTDIYNRVSTIFENSEIQERLFLAGIKGSKFEIKDDDINKDGAFRQTYHSREKELFDFEMTEVDLIKTVQKIKMFIQFSRNIGQGIQPYNLTQLNLRLHQLRELNLFRKIIKGQEIDV